MPIYEYECPECGNRIERLEKITDKNTKPKCDGCSTKMERIISNCSFQLKGSGWYVTDYKNTGGKKTRPVASNSG